MKFLFLSSIILGLVSCGNQSTSSLDRIPEFNYKGCPLLDINSAAIAESPINGVWEGLSSRADVGQVGVNIVIAQIGSRGMYTYMMHTFPITSNPGVKESCQSGTAFTPEDWKFYADYNHSKILNGDVNRYSLWLYPYEDGDLSGQWKRNSNSNSYGTAVSLSLLNVPLSNYVRFK